jgi:hypothetical protein
MTFAMTDSSAGQVDRPRLYDVFDDEGRAWLDEVVRAFNEGGYTEAVDAFLTDEAAAPGALDG